MNRCTRQTAPRPWQAFGGCDPAEAGLGPGGRDAEGHEPALGRGGDGGRQGGVERIAVPHQVVRRADPQDGLRPEGGLGVQGRQRHRRGGVAGRRLEQEIVLQPRIDRLVLAPDQHCLAGGRHRDHPFRRRHAQGPTHRRLEQRFLAEQLDQMLGEGRATDRPQPGAGAAGQDGRGKGREAGRRHHQEILRWPAQVHGLASFGRRTLP